MVRDHSSGWRAPHVLTDHVVLLYFSCSSELSPEGVRPGCCGVGLGWGAEPWHKLSYAGLVPAGQLCRVPCSAVVAAA